MPLSGEAIRLMNYIDDTAVTLRRVLATIPVLTPEERARVGAAPAGSSAKRGRRCQGSRGQVIPSASFYVRVALRLIGRMVLLFGLNIAESITSKTIRRSCFYQCSLAARILGIPSQSSVLPLQVPIVEMSGWLLLSSS